MNNLTNLGLAGRDAEDAGHRGERVVPRVRRRLGKGEPQHVERVPGAAQAGEHRVRPTARHE